jgi:nucleosome assembly protein 1-like 1
MSKEFTFNFADMNNVHDANHDEKEEFLSIEQQRVFAIEHLPEEIKPNIKKISEIQNKYEEVEGRFQEELLQLQKKYEKLYSPLFEERTKLVHEGIPNFWKTVLLQSELKDAITERDEDSLQYLLDITAETFSIKEKETPETNDNEKLNDSQKPSGGFTLTFHFAENPYFSNKTLTQTVYYDQSGDVISGKADGCIIDWKSTDKNLTVMKKVTKSKGAAGKKKGAKKPQATTALIPCDSFYNFFGKATEEEEDEEDEEVANIAGDDHFAQLIKDSIIPYAVDYFLGIVQLEDEYEIDPELLDNIEDEEEDEDEHHHREGGNKRLHGRNGPAVFKPDAQECKQQ